MPPIRSRLILPLVFTLAFTVARGASPEQQVEALMRPYRGGVPGAAVLVLHDGRTVLERGFGFADLEGRQPVTASTDFRLASMTKQFTAAAVLLLVEDGRLSLDDRIGRWLPTLPPVPAAATVRQLLCHTAGLIDYEDLIPPQRTEQLHDADVLELLEHENRTYFAPGTHYRYSDSGYSLLSLIVARASGRDFATFLRERIFRPLKMSDSLAYEAGVSRVPNRAFGYSLDKDRWLRTDQSLTSAVLGDGGVYSSIRDLARWDAALYDDRLLSAQSLQLSFTPATATDDANVRYGFGWRITGETVWHSGETLGFRNVIVRWPGRHFSVVVLTNRNDPEPYTLALAIAQAYLPDIDVTRATQVVVGPDSGARPLPPDTH
ncbi:MAG: beta-lactamase family protein [Proteobacteria bacterium]|nr:beta-lactamase family protein [Pseudomonadota bacterium]